MDKSILASNVHLTEENIKDFGFVKITKSNKDFANYFMPSNRFGISKALYSGEFIEEGSWYYGSDFIKIDTVEELKMLYLLVTKKELINKCY